MGSADLCSGLAALDPWGSGTGRRRPFRFALTGACLRALVEQRRALSKRRRRRCSLVRAFI